jgi:hypothetical protein
MERIKASTGSSCTTCFCAAALIITLSSSFLCPVLILWRAAAARFMSVWRSARRLSLFMHGNSSSRQYILEKIPVLTLSIRHFRHFTTMFIPESMIKRSSFICFQDGGGVRRTARQYNCRMKKRLAGIDFADDSSSVARQLIGAIEPLAGLDAMRERRDVEDLRLLCSGPGKVCQALGVTHMHNRLALDAPPFSLLARAEEVKVLAGSRSLSQPMRAPAV